MIAKLQANKKLRWATVGAGVLTVLSVVSLVLWNFTFSTTSGDHVNVHAIIGSNDARELKTDLRNGTADPDAAQTSNREGSPSSADEQFFQMRAYPAADVPADGYTNGFNQYSLMSQPGGGSFGWHELGPLSTPYGSSWGPATPSTISGRATAIAVDSASCSGGSCQTIYLGTANGGVWKTTTGGHNWVPLTEHQSTLAIGSLAIDPHNSNIIYAGTGEPNNAIDNDRGQGILKSTDGGHTWKTLGFNTFVNRAVADLTVDPSNGNLYAITYLGRSGGSGTVYGSSLSNPYLPPIGFFRSTDGGNTWTISNPTSTFFTDSTGRTGPTSLVRGSDGTLFLGVYGQGIYKSGDGGSTWTALPNSSETTFDRVTLAVAPSNPSVVYVAYSHDIDADAHGNGGMTFYASVNGGGAWTKQTNTPSACTGQCWYDMPVNVSPTDPNTVYVGGMFNYGGCPSTFPYSTSCNTVIMKSTDGGANWSDIGDDTSGVDVHPDDHAILATAQGGLYTANDGGLYHSADNGGSWESLNNGIGSLQFQGVSVNTDGDVFGGTQDNGTWMMRNSSTNGVHIQGGDGGMTAADPNNANIAFDEYYGSQMQRYDLSKGTQTWMAGWWCDYFCFGWGQFYEPMALGNKTPSGASASNVVLSGTNRLWRSKMGGGIDGDGNGDATNDPSDTTDFVPITPLLNSNITAIAVSPVDPNDVAFATNNGRIYFTTNALADVHLNNLCAEYSSLAGFCAGAGMSASTSGADACSKPWQNAYDTSSFCDYAGGVTWTRLDISGSTHLLPNRSITGLTFAPGSASKLYVTFSGFDQNTPGFSGHVFTTSNPGSSVSWANITGTGNTAIPNLPANDIVVTPSGRLVVAADFGIFSSKDNGATWQRDDYTLSNSPVYDLALSPDGKTLYAATHGRGIWRANVPGA